MWSPTMSESVSALLLMSAISLCDGQGWLSEAECVTGDGSVGRCASPSTCYTLSRNVAPVPCRYSRGYGPRICCPHSPSLYSSYDTYDSPITFPNEPPYSPYDEKPSYQPSYNTRPVQRPQYERPDYTSPNYGYDERPSSYDGYQGNSRPSVQRPDIPSRPRPGNWGDREPAGGNWDYQSSSNGGNGNRRTTARPAWAVGGTGNENHNNDRETSTSTKRISSRMCEEYSKSVSQTIGVLPLSLDSDAVPLTVQKCDFSAVKLIVGGEAAEPGEFPHMAAVGFQSGRTKTILWNCGGTLISDQYVLTAAHCVNTTYGTPVLVRLGEHNLARDDDGASPVDYKVESFVVHPNYAKSRKYNDIALLRLARRVRFGRAVRPACLPSETNVRGTPTASGWGRTDFVGRLSDVLMKVSLNVVDNRQCNQFYNTDNPGSSSFAQGIVDTMLCAGDLQGGRDTCLGDSGGPLTITKNDNPCVHYVVGITSFGKVCGAPKSPGVYTRVAKYLSWIERTIWP